MISVNRKPEHQHKSRDHCVGTSFCELDLHCKITHASLLQHSLRFIHHRFDPEEIVCSYKAVVRPGNRFRLPRIQIFVIIKSSYRSTGVKDRTSCSSWSSAILEVFVWTLSPLKSGVMWKNDNGIVAEKRQTTFWSSPSVQFVGVVRWRLHRVYRVIVDYEVCDCEAGSTAYQSCLAGWSRMAGFFGCGLLMH